MFKTSFSLDELCALVDLPRRTVRYYIQLGLVDRPIGETRAAHYTERHVRQLLTVKKWTQEGLSLQRIRELADEERRPQLPTPRERPGAVSVWSHVHVSEGVELQIEPGKAGLSPEQVRTFVRATMRAYREILDARQEASSDEGKDNVE